jgi:hypothetical protein
VPSTRGQGVVTNRQGEESTDEDRTPDRVRETATAIAVHIVNTPKSDAREAYEAAWAQIDKQGLRHPAGRQSHTAWLVGDVFHVLDVWDSADDMSAFMQKLGPILEESGMKLAGEPDVGELVNVVRRD